MGATFRIVALVRRSTDWVPGPTFWHFCLAPSLHSGTSAGRHANLSDEICHSVGPGTISGRCLAFQQITQPRRRDGIENPPSSLKGLSHLVLAKPCRLDNNLPMGGTFTFEV